ncbi:MAG: glucosaminidase domain-containing protein [Gammaproteobacteria bacterium]|nr:glucosaminidase domain-containing protein [Gammaproteobacteria bacterium]
MRFLIFFTLCISAISLTFAFPFKSKDEHINFLDYPAGAERKQAFIAYLSPIIEEKNRSLFDDRQKLIHLSQKLKLNIREQRWLNHISQYYGNDTFDTSDDTQWSALLEKVDIVPTSLAIAQAAQESGWGSSRFAQEANNYFGQWCYTKGCGLIPNDRNENAIHEVAKYKSIKESIVTYIHNLNTNRAYKEFRAIREQLRKSGQLLTGYQLAKGLQLYSERGHDYVREIQALIRNNKLSAWKASS